MNKLFPKGRMPEACSLIYVSGPLTGHGELEANKQLFREAETMLLSLGYSVFNPLSIRPPIIQRTPDELWLYYMHHCVRAIPDCDAMLMLPHWQNSRGAVWEHRIAEMLALLIMYSPVPDTGA